MMDNPPNSTSSKLASHEARVAPLAAAGAVAVATALTAYLTRPSRRSQEATRKRAFLVAYLRDHLSGSDVAIHVVRRLAAKNEGTHDGRLFRHLSEEFEQDRAIVRSLLEQLGASSRSPKRVAGYVSGLAVSVASGGEPGDLSLLRTLEGLAIGIQGKRCLWRALQPSGAAPSTDRINFLDLESKAVRQWEAIEERRRTLAAATFPAFAPRRHSSVV